MLSINNLNIQFATKQLFRNISVRVHKNDRIGLVGVNGSGKSTLLKIMAGLVETDEGVLLLSKNTSIGYLPQEISAVPHDRTLYEEAQTAFDHLLDLQKKVREINEKLSKHAPETPGFASLMKQQGELQHLLDHSDIFRMRSQIEKILLGLGFKESDLNKKCSAFSGGWLMRLMLAKLLLTKPSLVLLDEPTNHLDLSSLTWLEEFLKSYQGSMIIISHDRTFLDNTTSTTWELSLGNLTVYKGNFSKYVEEKDTRMEIQQAAYDNQQAKIQQTMRFVQRFRAKSTKAKQVQSRLRQLEKIDVIELEETERSINFRFHPSLPSGRLSIDVSHLAKSYGHKTVFHDVSFELQRGDKIAFVGVNGAGKSTLVKLLAGLSSPDSGTIRLGHKVISSYFGQHQAQELDPRYTVLETLAHAGSAMTTTQQRSLLGTFLFQGEDVDKKVQVLSGGEKSRLALAKMIATPANLMIMDEPTNHLDMMSQDVLQEAMAQYDGTIIVVSHNRYFLNTFVNRVLELKNGVATLYEGNIDDYLAKIADKNPGDGNADTLNNSRQAISSQGPPASPMKPKGKELRRRQAEIRQKKNKELAPLKKEVNILEKEIEKLEARKAELEIILADPELYKNNEAFSQQSAEYNDLVRRLERIYPKWEDNQQKIETLEAKFDAESGLDLP